MRRGSPLQTQLSHAAGWLAAAAGLIAVVVITALTSSPDNALGAALLFLGLLVGGFLAITVHELGHALAAAAVGWRVWIFSVLGVVIRFGHPARLSARLIQDVGGYVLPSPIEPEHDTRFRSIIVTAGGPLASVLTGPLFIAWLATLPRDGWETPTGAGLLGAVLAFGVASTSSALWTIWPMRDRAGHANDMGKILATLSMRAPPRDVSGLHWALGLSEFGVEPSAWPAWMRETVARTAPSPWAPHPAALLAFITALDAGDEPAARAAAERNGHGEEKLMRAFVRAFFDRDPNGAETLLAATPAAANLATLNLMRAFTEARILALRNDAAGAERAYQSIAHELAAGPPLPFWERLLERAQSAP